jgi:hypothetical protein
MFWFNAIGSSAKKRKNRGSHPLCPQEVLEIHDGCFTRAPLTWGLPSSTPLPFLPEWQRRNVGFSNIYSLFYKGIRPSDSRRRPTKLTGYFCLDRAGLVEEKTDNSSWRFWLGLLHVFPIWSSTLHWTKLDCKTYCILPSGTTLSNTLPSWSWRSRRLAIKNFGNYEKIEIKRATYLKHGTETAVLSNGNRQKCHYGISQLKQSKS